MADEVGTFGGTTEVSLTSPSFQDGLSLSLPLRVIPLKHWWGGKLQQRTNIFLDELPWDMRSRNTDWRYVRYSMPRLTEFEPELIFTQQESLNVSVYGNIRTIRAALGRRMGIPLSDYALTTSRLSEKELARSKADVVFAHRAFPVNAGEIPVVWQSAVIDPHMQRSYGATDAMLQAEMEVKEPLFAKSSAVQVSTQAEAKRHALTFPHLANKFVAVPFFMPHLKACGPEALERHSSAVPVRVLFVGNHAIRKGLDVLLEAFLSLPAPIKSRATLTVISNFDRSDIKFPADDRITVIRGMKNAQVLGEMARSHILVNVARLESYGLVFQEAMSQGMACLGPKWEVQREIFDEGRAGRNVDCDAAAVRLALEELISDDAQRYALGLAGWERFCQEYAPAVVAQRYAQLFRQVRYRY